MFLFSILYIIQNLIKISNLGKKCLENRKEFSLRNTLGMIYDQYLTDMKITTFLIFNWKCKNRDLEIWHLLWKCIFFKILIRRLQILCLLINIGIVCYVTYVYVDFYDLKIDFWIDYCRTLYSNLHKIWIRLIETWPCPVNEITGHSVAIVIAWRSIISITGWVIITNKTCWVYWWGYWK